MKKFARQLSNREWVGPKSQTKVALLILLAWMVGLSACQDFRANPTEGYSDLGLTEKPHQEKPRPQQAYDRLFVMKTNDNEQFFSVGQSRKLFVEIRFLQPVTSADLVFQSAELNTKVRMTRLPARQGDSAQTFRYSLDVTLPSSQLGARSETPTSSPSVKSSQNPQYGFVPYTIEVENVQSADPVVTALYQSVILEHEGALAFIDPSQPLQQSLQMSPRSQQVPQRQGAKL